MELKVRIAEAAVFCVGAIAFLVREGLWVNREKGLLGYIQNALTFAVVLGIITDIYLFSDHKIISDLPKFGQMITISVALSMAFYVVLPAVKTAVQSLYHSPIEFFDIFRDSQVGHAIPGTLKYKTFEEICQQMDALWKGSNPAKDVRREGFQQVDLTLREMRAFVLKVLLTTFPVLIFAFSLVSLAGQNLGWWTIVRSVKSGDLPDNVLSSLVDHLYFCTSVVSTLGLGDTRPAPDSAGLGQLFVVGMLITFLLVGLVVFSLIISFAHSLSAFLEGKIDCIIDDLKVDLPRPCPIVCPLADAGFTREGKARPPMPV
jgi:hypothetical protein